MIKIITGIGIGVFVLGLFANVNCYAMGSRHQSEPAVNYDVNRLIGTQVKNFKGEMLGAINDFVVDQEGRIIFAVLDHDGKFVAIPFSALSISGSKTEELRVVLNADKEKLDGAPEFGRTRVMTDRRWAGDVYRYFGEQPYWTEKSETPPETPPGSNEWDGGGYFLGN